MRLCTGVVAILVVACGHGDRPADPTPAHAAPPVVGAAPMATVSADSIARLEATLERELAPLDHWRDTLVAALRPDSGTERADAMLLSRQAIDGQVVRDVYRSIMPVLEVWADAPNDSRDSSFSVLDRPFARRGLSAYGSETSILFEIDQREVRRIAAPYVTQPMRMNLDLDAAESAQHAIDDEALMIGTDDLEHRIVLMDSILAMAPDFADAGELKDNRKGLVNVLLAGLPNSKVFDLSTHQLPPDYRTELAKFAGKRPESWSGTIVARYLEILKAHDWRPSSELEDFLKTNGMWLMGGT